MVKVELSKGGLGTAHRLVGSVKFSDPPNRLLEVLVEPVDILTPEQVRELADRLAIKQVCGQVGEYNWKVD